ncbi:hypothetical protein Q5P01_002950 [Channa striata]|uniref:G-protein coupled receptors family 1 profile domain-containing protein n=1 Tax=Channa striata TaxID=64152 RepID=A0AA88T585_CHASR|nr:hypothetical protein Q5P01_002950 [Channa striata]
MSIISTNYFDSPSNNSLSLHDIQCFDSAVGRYVVTAISLAYILFILPVSVFVLYLGFQQWKQCSLSGATVTYSDFFTYNMAVIEFIGVFGYAFNYCSTYAKLQVMLIVGAFLWSFIWPAQTLFPILTCVEHYLAVVRPITYRGLRQAGGVRIRNIITGSIWLICFIWGIFVILLVDHYYKRVIAAFVLILSLIVTVFCSLSVLRVLIRPRPGKVGRDRVQIDQSKRRAIHTILIIMGVLWLKICGNVITNVIRFSTQLIARCVAEGLAFLVILPSSLVLPLLFLQRAGKLPNCKHITGAG